MRIELVHPLIVHFPLALLLTGTMLRLVCFPLRKRPAVHSVIISSSWLLLLLGICFAWIAILAGEFAQDIVRNGLCKPEVLEHHMDLAYTAATLFSLALLIDLGKAWKKDFLHSSVLSWIMTLLYATAAVVLILTGSFGANLVYEQGAAVERSCQKS